MEKSSLYPEKCMVSRASATTVANVVRYRPKHIAEVGAYKGFTTMAVLSAAEWVERYDIFDFEDRVDEIIRLAPENVAKKLRGFGNSRRAFDSYNERLFELVKDSPAPIYDYVFLDGAHTLCHDALAFYLLDRLLRPGGLFEFDDYSWSLAKSPTINPDAFPMTRVLYSESQIRAEAVKDVIEHLVLPTGRYECVDSTRLFRKNL